MSENKVQPARDEGTEMSKSKEQVVTEERKQSPPPMYYAMHTEPSGQMVVAMPANATYTQQQPGVVQLVEPWRWCTLVTSVISMFFCSCCGIPATILSLLAYVEYKAAEYGVAARRLRVAKGLAITAIVIGAVLLAASVAWNAMATIYGWGDVYAYGNDAIHGYYDDMSSSSGSSLYSSSGSSLYSSSGSSLYSSDSSSLSSGSSSSY